MTRTAWNDYAAEYADAKQDAERHYTPRQMRHGENAPDDQELAHERRSS